MRLIARDDTFLTATLIASVAIVFQQPLHNVLASIHDIEGRLHLDLLPGLLVLIVAFSFHQYGKRAQARAEALAAVADAAQARAQSHVLQQLMVLSRALSTALDRQALQQAVFAHLPGLAPRNTLWVLVRTCDQWEPLMYSEAVGVPVVDLGRIADQALQPGSLTATECLPLRAGANIVGALGVAAGSTLDEGDRQTLEAAAAILGIGIRNMQLFLETRELSLRDGLTGCFNRSHALQTLDAEVRRGRRSGTPLSIVLFDVDHFKSVNDRYGHLRGDELLATVGDQIVHAVRTSDTCCRYGGDEFLIILPDTPIAGAQHVAEAIRNRLAILSVSPEHGAVTISVGVAAAQSSDRDGKSLIDRADTALYRAKDMGRDRVAVAAHGAFLSAQRRRDASVARPA